MGRGEARSGAPPPPPATLSPCQEVLDIARLLVLEQGAQEDSEAEEQKSKLEQLKTVLEM